jgi:carbonic anhydrase
VTVTRLAQGTETPELKVDRRTAIVGAGCLALAAMLPGGARAVGGVRTESRLTAASLPRQSPIDLREDEITFVRRLPRIRFAYPHKLGVRLENTGEGEFDTVRANVPPGAAHITLSGVRWELRQFHWHTPSEHEVEGRYTPLEMHLVHRRSDGALLVIAVFFKRGRLNCAIEPIFRDLPEPGELRDVPAVRLRGLLPDERESFRYSGSLTTPPFTEPVAFVVLAEPIALSRRQIGAFQALYPDGNSREVQALNGREVLSDAEDTFYRCRDGRVRRRRP